MNILFIGDIMGRSGREALEKLFMRCDMPPLFIEDGFEPDDLTEYFYQFVAA